MAILVTIYSNINDKTTVIHKDAHKNINKLAQFLETSIATLKSAIKKKEKGMLCIGKMSRIHKVVYNMEIEEIPKEDFLILKKKVPVSNDMQSVRDFNKKYEELYHKYIDI